MCHPGSAVAEIAYELGLAPNSVSTIVTQLARFAAGLGFEDLPPEVVSKAKICVLDTFGMLILSLPFIMPVVIAAGVDKIWFGVFVVIVVEMAQITPPVGFNLFVLQGMTKREITWIAKVTIPYFLLMVLALALLWWFPQIATWLPGRM